MDTLSAILALLALNVLVNMGVWFRLGNLTGEVKGLEGRVERLEAAR